MSNKITAVEITGNSATGDVFDVGYTILGDINNMVTVELYRVSTKEPFAVMSVRHAVDETRSWFLPFYETLLYNAMLGVNEYNPNQLRLPPVNIECLFSKITWRNDLGKLFLRIHNTGPLQDQDYGMVIDFEHRDLHPNSRKLSHFTVFHNTHSTDTKSVSGRYTANGLMFVIYKGEENLNIPVHCSFANALTDEDILKISIEGDKALSLTKDRFLIPEMSEEVSKYLSQFQMTKFHHSEEHVQPKEFDYSQLSVVSLGDFFYLESPYRDIRITLQPQAGLKAIRGVYQEIEKHEYVTFEEKKSWRKKFSKELTKLMLAEEMDLEKAVLNFCVNFHDQFRDSVWIRAMSGSQSKTD